MMEGKSMTDVIADIRKRAENAHDLYVDDPDETVHHEAVSGMLLHIAEAVEAAFVRDNDEYCVALTEAREEAKRLREALDKIEDQVRWTIAHIECDELDDATGALYTAEAALEHINRAKGANA